VSRPRPRGISLLEVLLAILLVFMAASCLLGLFGSGQGLALRGREYSIATLLAGNRMEELLACPLEDVSPGTGEHSEPYRGYTWEVALHDFEGDLKMLEVLVLSPRGARCALRTLRRTSEFFGIACDPWAGWLVFSVPGDPAVRILQDGSRAAPGPSLPPGPSPARAGGLAGPPGAGFLWVADQVHRNVVYFRQKESGGFEEGEVHALVPPSEVKTPTFAGLASDGFANRLVLADRANRALWILADSPVDSERVRGPLAPREPALGTPAGVAVDGSASVVWVADAEHGCLRQLLVGGEPASPADYEVEPGVGWWNRECFRPEEGMGSPQGVAVNPWSSAVLCVDEGSLHLLEFVPMSAGSYAQVWSRRRLPDDLIQARPSGICLDPFRNVVYLNTRRGQVWKSTLVAPGGFEPIHGGEGE
jgi:hypothetical protein